MGKDRGEMSSRAGELGVTDNTNEIQEKDKEGTWRVQISQFLTGYTCEQDVDKTP